ncbi:MAG: hypothetical protein PHH48_07530 [Eubacteriales bacterium]|nr:hypothetical protein [Eubacteriales bacterium]
MLKVVFIGDKEDFLTAQLLKEKMKLESVMEISEESFSCTCEQPEMVIVKSKKLKNISSAGIIVFQSDSAVTNELKISSEAVCVINSCNKNSIEFICSNSISAITCGLSENDTFTISGISDEQAAVSLQRPIETLSGKMIEPCEFVINLTKPVPRYDIMELTAILVLTDNEHLLKNIKL